MSSPVGIVVNRREELSLAWALVDSASQHLPPDVRTWLCTSIGAGDLDISIQTALSRLAHNNAELPQDVMSELERWLRGYEGTDTEHVLREFVSRLGVSKTEVRQTDPIRSPRLTIERGFKPLTRTAKPLLHR